MTQKSDMIGRRCRRSRDRHNRRRPSVQHLKTFRRKTSQIILILLSILVLGTITTCGATPSQATPSPAGPTPTVTVPFELPVTIALAGSFDDQTLALLDKQIASFERENPDIKVEIVAAPREGDQRHTKFATHLDEGDTSRDIYVLNPTWLAKFNTNGWLAHIDDYVEAYTIQVSDFLPATVQANTLDGRLIALPWLADGGLLYYRRDLLEKHGYRPPATWSELQEIALEIKAKEDLPTGFVWQGAAYESLTCNTLESIWAHGGDVLDGDGTPVFDSEGTRAGLQQMSDLVVLGVSPSDVATYQEPGTLAAFQNGDAVFMRNWSYAWDRLNDTGSPLAGQIGIAPLPASCLGGQSLALSPHSLHPDQAFRFLAFLVGYEQQLQVARLGVQPPALETVYHNAALLDEEPIFGDLLPALSATRPRPQSSTYSVVSQAIFEEVNRMLRGEQDVETTVLNVQRRIEAAAR